MGYLHHVSRFCIAFIITAPQTHVGNIVGSDAIFPSLDGNQLTVGDDNFLKFSNHLISKSIYVLNMSVTDTLCVELSHGQKSLRCHDI